MAVSNGPARQWRYSDQQAAVTGGVRLEAKGCIQRLAGGDILRQRQFHRGVVHKGVKILARRLRRQFRILYLVNLRITSIPTEMPVSRATKAVQETLAALAENRSDGAIEKAAAELACHSAVRFGDVLDVAEQRRLLTDLEQAEESITCPHGRPTRLLVEWQELTRHFRRNY